jgi:hypothetical protein
MNADFLLLLLSCASALLLVATVRIYDRLLRDVEAERDALLAEREELLDDNDMAIELLTEALKRHPAKGPTLRSIK